MSEAKHTPTPWFVSRGKSLVRCRIGNTEFNICDVGCVGGPLIPEGEANATFIVRACNNFDALLAGCKMALGAFERNDCIDWNILSRAIAAAEGKD